MEKIHFMEVGVGKYQAYCCWRGQHFGIEHPNSNDYWLLTTTHNLQPVQGSWSFTITHLGTFVTLLISNHACTHSQTNQLDIQNKMVNCRPVEIQKKKIHFPSRCKYMYNEKFGSPDKTYLPKYNYRKHLSDTWWRLRTRFGHRQYLFLCKAHTWESIEIRAHQIVGCWSWIIQACISVTFQWKFLREPSKNTHEKIEILRSMI